MDENLKDTPADAAKPRKRSRWPRRLLVWFLIIVGLFVYSRQFHPELEDVPGQRALLAQRVKADTPLRVDALSVLGDVKTLSSKAFEGRKTGTPGGARARAYIEQRMTQIGLEPAFGRSYEQPFRFTPFRGIMFWRKSFWEKKLPIDGVNLAGLVRGSVDPQHYLLVTAHFDHLGIRDGKLYPGADDNASGVGAMLAAAAWFRAHPPKHSILFVAFDGEERGLKGSYAFVDKPPVPLANMLVDVNFDMVSRNPDHEIYVTGLYQNPQLKPLLDPVRAKAVPTVLYGHDYPRPFWDIFLGADDWTEQSDQGAFADENIPFIYLGVADHPDYHQPGDTFEHIDPKFYVGVSDMILDVIAALDAADAATLRHKAQ
jgi:hypothetical protein